MNHIKSKKRLLAILLCLCLTLVLSLSYYYIFTNSKHICSGHDCRVCEQLQIAEHLIEQIKHAIVPTVIIIMTVLLVYHFKKLVDTLFEKDSPVDRKVRLNH